MNDMKKTTIIDRIRNAWRALAGKPAQTLTIGIETRRCAECEYYKRAHEPAETAQEAPRRRYWHEIHYLDDAVLAVLYEATETGTVEVARSRGRIFHEDAEGIAQAVSYATKGIWYKIRNS